MGRDILKDYDTAQSGDFNSHARVGRDLSDAIVKLIFVDFNSHARVGRDSIKFLDECFCRISTHTPAWGVTRKTRKLNKKYHDFNSHARVGRDRDLLGIALELNDFNSHARVGRDVKYDSRYDLLE